MLNDGERKIMTQPADRIDEVAQRRAVIAELKEQGVDVFGSRFQVSHSTSELIRLYDEAEKAGTQSGMPADWTFAGRLVARRGHGKAGFGNVQDLAGRLQIYVRKDIIGEEPYALWKKLYLGDMVGLEGQMFRTDKGEISMRVEKLTLLAKAVRPLPEKWHGLQDIETRYRMRHLDLIVNTDARQVFLNRVRMIRVLRNYLDDRGFLEVETPVLHAIYGGASARPFRTHHNALGMDFYLRIALELHLKRLIVGGLEKVYEISRVFRNEGVSVRHNPEFTMFEAYWAYADYQDMMNLVEEVVGQMAMALHGKLQIEYQGQEINLTPPWRRISFRDALKEESGIDILELTTLEKARAVAEEHGVPETDRVSIGKILDSLFSRYVDPKLQQPTIIYDYPLELSPLAKKIPDQPLLTYRFEGFIAGMEICNAFSELNDPEDQRARFEAQVEAGKAGDEEAHPIDEEFLAALEQGMPPTGGIGIGIDRLCMILSNAASVRDVILFPHMRLTPEMRAAAEEEGS